MTIIHHLRSPEIAGAIGSLAGLYVAIGITAAAGFINVLVYFTGKPTA